MSDPLTVVVRRRVKSGRERAFEDAMQEFIGFALAAPGHAGIHVLRPAAGSRDYTVVDRFADVTSREAFKASAAYREWMRSLGELTEGDPRIVEQEGLAGWFEPPPDAPHAARPPTYKMAAVTFVGVFPLTSVLPPVVNMHFPGWHPLLANVLVTGLVVGALAWVVMPLLTRIAARWLYP